MFIRLTTDFPIKHPEIRQAAILDGVCPICADDLDTGWECDSCQFDGLPEIEGLL
jgi:hypothetical protein